MSTDHYAEAQAFVTEALDELDPQNAAAEYRRSMDAAKVHATLALVDVLAAWCADLDSEPHPQPLQMCEAKSPHDAYLCSLPAGHRGEHVATIDRWPNGGAT